MIETSTTGPPPFLAFTPTDVLAAHKAWGCSCGPAALAATCGLPLDAVRDAIPGFDMKGFANVIMMRAGLASLGCRYRNSDEFHGAGGADKPWPRHGLVRIQWGGPWTTPGAPPRWASRFTHWVAAKDVDGCGWVYDVNAGWLVRAEWEADVVPRIIESIPRADGSWAPTHRWEVRRGEHKETT